MPRQEAMRNETPVTLPAKHDIERLVLGQMILDGDCAAEVLGVMTSEDFALDKHRRIFRRMAHLFEIGSPIDRVTVIHALQQSQELEAVGGVTYLTSLDDGLPEIVNLDAYVKILQEVAVLRRMMFTCEHFMNRCGMPGENSVAIVAAMQEAMAKIGEKQQPHGQWFRPGDVVREYPGGLQAFLDPQRGGSGLTTPWQRFDETTCGLQEGDLVVIAARTSMGKSIVGMQCAHHTAAKEKRPVAVFSLEMSKESLIRRLIASVARIDHQQVRSGHLSKDERLRAQRAATEIAEIPLWIDDTRARTIAAMSAALRKLKDPPRLIVVDHLQFMKATGKTENRHQELSDIVHSLKHMAGEYKATCMVLSQLNRQCEIENRRPQLSDLRETGTIEEDADIVMFVHRWERYQKYKERLEYRGLGEFLLAKQRNGPLAKFNMIFNDGYQRFDTAANDGGWGDDGE